MSDDVALMSAQELIRRFRSKELSPVEAVRAALDRIARHDGTYNAFVLVDEDAALAAARAAEDRWQRGEPIGLVDGVPTGIKDMFLTKGWPTRRGSLTIPADGPWDEDSPLVARLREHGAVLIGKTTLPEFGWKGVNDSPLTGITRNPWNAERTPGGSSGGAAVAAALGMGALHAGGDGAGSIRIPAAFTGIFGIKPTFGRVPNYPLKMPGTITHAGPMTRTVADAALMLTVMAEPDHRDWLSLPYTGANYLDGLDDGVKGMRIAYSPGLGYVELDAEVRDAVDRAVRVFEQAGATVEVVDPGFPDPRDAFEIYYNIRFAYLYDTMPDEKRRLLDPGIVTIAEHGRQFGLHDIIEADAMRDAVASRMAAFHTRHDLLITAQMRLTAFEAGIDYPRGREFTTWLDWSPLTYPFNFTHQPAASVPCGFSSDGLPIALQIVGQKYREDLVLRASRAFEKVQPFALSRL